MCGNNTISAQITKALIGMLPTPVNLLRNNGSSKQAILKCKLFVYTLFVLRCLEPSVTTITQVRVTPAAIVGYVVALFKYSNENINEEVEIRNTMNSVTFVTRTGILLTVIVAYLYSDYKDPSQKIDNMFKVLLKEFLIEYIMSRAVIPISSIAADTLEDTFWEAILILVALTIEDKRANTSFESCLQYIDSVEVGNSLAYKALGKYGTNRNKDLLLCLAIYEQDTQKAITMWPNTLDQFRNMIANEASSVMIKKLLLRISFLNKYDAVKFAEIILKYAPSNDSSEKIETLPWLKQFLIKETARKHLHSADVNPFHKHLPYEIWNNIRELRGATIDEYVLGVNETRTLITHAFNNKKDRLHVECMKQLEATRHENDLDKAKMIFLKILKIMSIPLPTTSTSQERYRAIFKFKFLAITESKGCNYFVENEDEIYATAESMKKSSPGLENIDFSQLLNMSIVNIPKPTII